MNFKGFKLCDSESKLVGEVLRAGPDCIEGWIIDKSRINQDLKFSFCINSEPVIFTDTFAAREMTSDSSIRRYGHFILNLQNESVRDRIRRRLSVISDIQNNLHLSLSVQYHGNVTLNVRMFDDLNGIDLCEILGFDGHFILDRTYKESAEKSKVKIRNGDSTPFFICFYLPQFHPIKENDEWWGRGFTEWTNVANMRPQFPDHKSPWLPADLGFYDLRLKKTRQLQGELAKLYGVDAFCYYVYWFQGRRLLQEPLNLLLEDGEPNIPFCLCWANETWSRRWDGSDSEVLIAQKHDLDTDVNFIADMSEFLRDPRYVRVDGKAVVLIYRPVLIPDRKMLFKRWRKEAERLGVGEIMICNVMTFGDEDPYLLDCDVAVEFPPHSISAARLPETFNNEGFSGTRYDYLEVLANAAARQRSFPYFPGVMPRWDNSPRKGRNATVFVKSNPDAFEVWLRFAVSRIDSNESLPNIVFINSWNEWAEGAHLEPDSRFGHKYLEAVRRVKEKREIVPVNLKTEGLASLISVDDMMSSVNRMSMFIHQLARAKNDISRVNEIQLGVPLGWAEAVELDSATLIIESISSSSSIKVASRNGDRVSIRGWSYVSHKFEPRQDRHCCLVLLREAGDEMVNFHSWAVDVYKRMDIKEHFKSLSQHDEYGFQAEVLFSKMPEGEYLVCLLEFDREQSYLLRSNRYVIISG